MRGQCTIQGTVYSMNTVYRVHLGDNTPEQYADGQHGKWIDGQRLERYEASICGYYTNCYVSLDKKSGLVGESAFSEQFGQSLRLS